MSGPVGQAKPANDDIDWDDEDEKTAIFDKHSPEDVFPGAKKPLPAAGAPAAPPSGPKSASAIPMPPLPSGSRPGHSMPPPPPMGSRALGSAPPPPPVPSVRPPSNQPPSQPSAPRLALPPVPTASRAPERLAASPAAPAVLQPVAKAQGPGKMLWIALGVLLVGMAAFAAVMLLPATGSIVVAVSGPGNRAIDSVQVFVDGKKHCDTSPCVANGIPAGTHFVKVQAQGYTNPGAQAVKVVRGDEAVLNLQLSGASEGTGLKVSAEGSGLKLLVDGKEIGLLPQEVKELAPGDHQVRVESGNGRFEPYEEKVTVVADQMKAIGPLLLKVKRGTATIEAGSNADGAKVLLVAGSEKRQIPKLPYKVDIDTSRGYQIVASKKGFASTTLPISFEPGKDQKQFTVNLKREGEASAAGDKTGDEPAAAEAVTPSAEATPAPTPPAHVATSPGGDPRKARLNNSATNTATPATKTTATSTPAAGQGTLNINSIPQSNVLLDGRPLGKTPRAGVSVGGGSHTVVFIHPEHGRKQVVVTVIPGRTATAAVRFP